MVAPQNLVEPIPQSVIAKTLWFDMTIAELEEQAAYWEVVAYAAYDRLNPGTRDVALLYQQCCERWAAYRKKSAG